MYLKRFNKVARAAACAALVGGAVLPTMAGAQDGRFGFVNTPVVLEQAPQAKQARDRLQTEFAPRDQELVDMTKRIEGLQEKLKRDGSVMSETERRKLERDIVAEQRELKRARDAFGEDFNIRRNEEFAKLQRHVAKVIVDVAKENGYDLILESGVVYASDRVDITTKVVERLQKGTAAP